MPTSSDHRAIERLHLGRDESVHVYANGLIVYIVPNSADPVVGAIAATVSIANLLPSIKTRLPNVPKEFAPLKPLLTTWAKSDDEERSDAAAAETAIVGPGVESPNGLGTANRGEFGRAERKALH